MKKIKRLAALVLAGVMMMLMLTACGGAMTPAEQFEKRLSDSIRAVCGTNVKNIKSETKAALEQIGADGSVRVNMSSAPAVLFSDDKDVVYILDGEMKGDKVASLTVTAVGLQSVKGDTGKVDCYTEEQLMNAANTDMSELVEGFSELAAAMGYGGNPIMGIGVATRQLTNGRYIYGFTMKIKC